MWVAIRKGQARGSIPLRHILYVSIGETPRRHRKECMTQIQRLRGRGANALVVMAHTRTITDFENYSVRRGNTYNEDKE